MINFENTEVLGWGHAIRGMRNPMNSWEKSDSYPGYDCAACGRIEREGYCNPKEHDCSEYFGYEIGPNDHDLMKRLRNAGTDHRKFMRMITVYVDITGPLYWWKEFDTYRVGVEKNSCSTMHKIAAKEFTMEDFSYEHLMHASIVTLGHTIDDLNQYRRVYLYGGELCDKHGNWVHFEPNSKDVWWQMIQLLPSSYNQKRTVMLNYEVLANIYKSRRTHKLDEWHTFCDWIESLPYSELITVLGKNNTQKKEGIMKQYRIELERDYFKAFTFAEERISVGMITGLLWGVCSIPCDTYKWMPTSNRPSAIIFSAVCDKEHLTKFLDSFYLIYPGIKDYIKVIEEDEKEEA